jgi:hypothetical protein
MTQEISNGLAGGSARGQTSFFFRSPFRNGPFVVVSILFVVLIVAYISILAVYWSRMSSGLATLLFLMTVPGGAGPMFRSLRQHSRIQELYLAGKIDEVDPMSPLGVALDVAADGIYNGLFFTLAAELVLLLIVAYFLHPFH